MARLAKPFVGAIITRPSTVDEGESLNNICRVISSGASPFCCRCNRYDVCLLIYCCSADTAAAAAADAVTAAVMRIICQIRLLIIGSAFEYHRRLIYYRHDCSDDGRVIRTAMSWW